MEKGVGREEEEEEEEEGGKKEGNGAIKRQSQASNFQVICFHHAGKMFRFASFCRHSFARLTFNRNPVLAEKGGEEGGARGHSKK